MIGSGQAAYLQLGIPSTSVWDSWCSGGNQQLGERLMEVDGSGIVEVLWTGIL